LIDSVQTVTEGDEKGWVVVVVVVAVVNISETKSA
jgi:hypothetical protein